MNRFYSGIVYAVEKERYAGHKDLYPHTKQLLELIWKYKNKIHLLVGGDHHLYAESLVCFNRTCIPQVYILLFIDIIKMNRWLQVDLQKEVLLVQN